MEVVESSLEVILIETKVGHQLQAFGLKQHGLLGLLDETLQVCPLICQTILTGIREVSKNLNYLGKEKAASHSNKPVITFLCSCETTTLHPAIMMDDGKYLRCPDFCKSEALTRGHKTWLKGKYVAMIRK